MIQLNINQYNLELTIDYIKKIKYQRMNKLKYL